MALNFRLPMFFSRFILVIVIGIVVLIAPASNAQLSDLKIVVGDTTAMPLDQNTVISIYMTNYHDVIAGFNLWIQLDRPDLIKFQIDTVEVVDTTYWKCLEWDGSVCIDSMISNPQDYDFTTVDIHDVAVGNHDTTGTMVSGWEYVDSRSLSGQGNDINIAAFSNMPSPPETPGISPQQDGLLIKVLADVLDVDSLELDRTVNLMIQYDLVDHFNFSRTDGSSIGIAYEQFIDSTCWKCSQWVSNVCMDWYKESVINGDYSSCDSIEVKPDSSAYVDTDKIILIDGSLTVLVPSDCVCGDINGDDYHLSDISDLMFLVSYLFNDGAEPPYFCCADVDGSGGDLIGISDLTYEVSYLFQYGPAPICSCN
ncbi:MAG: hypothetical protein DRP35_04685 [Candidatus Zixiibacteriota bacterium]|nr:MAG: hypothetical protein DRP35_04685 [candidate division Zixibacteria bacterium]